MANQANITIPLPVPLPVPYYQNWSEDKSISEAMLDSAIYLKLASQGKVVELPFHLDRLQFAAESTTAPIFCLTSEYRDQEVIDIGKLGRVAELDVDEVQKVLHVVGSVIYHNKDPKFKTKTTCRTAVDVVNALGLRFRKFISPSTISAAIPEDKGPEELVDAFKWLQEGHINQFREEYSRVKDKILEITWESNETSHLGLLPPGQQEKIKQASISYGRKQHVKHKRKFNEIQDYLGTIQENRKITYEQKQALLDIIYK